MDPDRFIRWLYALGIGFLMFSATLYLFLTYRFTDEALFAATLCTIIGIALSVGGFAMGRMSSRPIKN